jgi:hypothetical protein
MPAPVENNQEKAVVAARDIWMRGKCSYELRG